MKDFWFSALPWVTLGLAVAVIATNYSKRKEGKMAGVALSACNLHIEHE